MGVAVQVSFIQSQCAIKGELGSAIAAGFDPADRSFADLTGTGVQDTAIATLARQRAEAAGSGTTFTS